MNKVENEHPVGEDPILWWHRCSGSDVLLRARDWGTLQGSGGSDWGWDGMGWEGDWCQSADMHSGRNPWARHKQELKIPVASVLLMRNLWIVPFKHQHFLWFYYYFFPSLPLLSKFSIEGKIVKKIRGAPQLVMLGTSVRLVSRMIGWGCWWFHVVIEVTVLKLNPAFVFWEREHNIFHINASDGLSVGPDPICCTSCVAGSPEMPLLSTEGWH